MLLRSRFKLIFLKASFGDFISVKILKSFFNFMPFPKNYARKQENNSEL